jgi:hypothetical protein
MGTTNLITVINKTDLTMTLDKGHLHINHYDSPAREDIVSEIGVIKPNETRTVKIIADSKSHRSTLEMSYHLLDSDDHNAVRYQLKQEGTTTASVNKNQLGHTASARTEGHAVFFELGG